MMDPVLNDPRGGPKSPPPRHERRSGTGPAPTGASEPGGHPGDAEPSGPDSTLERKRRTYERFPIEVSVDLVSEHNFFAGLSLNVSEGGLFVATHLVRPVGSRLE